MRWLTGFSAPWLWVVPVLLCSGCFGLYTLNSDGQPVPFPSGPPPAGGMIDQVLLMAGGPGAVALWGLNQWRKTAALQKQSQEEIKRQKKLVKRVARVDPSDAAKILEDEID